MQIKPSAIVFFLSLLRLAKSDSVANCVGGGRAHDGSCDTYKDLACGDHVVVSHITLSIISVEKVSARARYHQIFVFSLAIHSFLTELYHLVAMQYRPALGTD
jgi:hypothetical protein